MVTIKSATEVETVFKTGKRYKTPYFMMLVSETPIQRDPCGRVAFIAGKKLGNAPLRSRCKRVLREMVRQSDYTWPTKDVIFIANASISTVSPVYLRSEYIRVLKQADLLEATAK